MIKKHFWGVFRCGGGQHRGHFAHEILAHTLQAGHSQGVKCPISTCSAELPPAEIGAHYETCRVQYTKQMKHDTYRRANEMRVCDICGKNVGKAVYDQHLQRCRVKSEGGPRKVPPSLAPDRTICCEMCGKQFSGEERTRLERLEP